MLYKYHMIFYIIVHEALGPSLSSSGAVHNRCLGHRYIMASFCLYAFPSARWYLAIMHSMLQPRTASSLQLVTDSLRSLEAFL